MAQMVLPPVVLSNLRSSGLVMNLCEGKIWCFTMNSVVMVTFILSPLSLSAYDGDETASREEIPDPCL